jgi:divalent metal cation (Fe/Co/Zn/Cd) transporter
VLLIVIAVILAKKMKSLLTGESADPTVNQAIRAAVLDGPEIAEIIHFRTLHLGPEELLIGIKVVFAGEYANSQAAATNAVEARVRAVTTGAKYLFVESGLPTQADH